MIPKGKSYHLQSNRPFALVDHVINFRSTPEQFAFEFVSMSWKRILLGNL